MCISTYKGVLISTVQELLCLIIIWGAGTAHKCYIWPPGPVGHQCTKSIQIHIPKEDVTFISSLHLSGLYSQRFCANISFCTFNFGCCLYKYNFSGFWKQWIQGKVYHTKSCNCVLCQQTSLPHSVGSNEHMFRVFNCLHLQRILQ